MSKDQVRVIYPLVGIATAIIGKAIHGSIFWAVMNFIFWPLSWIKWLIFQDVNITIIKGAFDFFIK